MCRSTNRAPLISGVFNLYGAETGCFGAAEQALLEQMGADLGFALEQAARDRRLRAAERAMLIAAERERTAEAQREQARMLAESQRIARIGSWQYAFRDPIVWSAETYRLYGVDPAAFTPTLDGLLGLLHSEDRPALKAWISACASGEQPGELLFRRLMPDGSLRYLIGQGELIRDVDGQPRHMVGTVQDITERHTAEIRAQADEERLRLALNAAQLGIFEWDLASGQLDWSAHAAELFGFPTDTRRVPFGQAASRLHPEDRERVLASIDRSRSERAPYACDYRVVWIGASGEFSYGPDGRATQLRGVLQDITERQAQAVALREAEAEQRKAAALRASEARFRLLANAAPALIWMAGLDQGCTWFNDQWLAFTGRTFDEEYGNGWAEGVHPEDRARCLAVYDAHFAARQPFQMEYRLRRHDGEYRWLLDHGAPLFDADGTFSGYVGACIDITANKTLTLELERAQAAQIAQTMRLQTILATISDGLHIVNARGRLLECNVSFARMLGYTPEEAAHLRVADWEAEIPAAAQPARLAALLAQPARFETRHRRKDGAVIDVEISTNSLELAGERCLLAAARDITERKQAEAALRASEQQFRALSEAIPQIVWMTRADGWNIYFNQQWVDYTGMSLAESYGHGWNIPFHPDDQQRAWDAWQQAVQTDGVYALECRLRRADGAYRWWLIRGNALHDEDGHVINWFGTCTDIQAMKDYEGF